MRKRGKRRRGRELKKKKGLQLWTGRVIKYGGYKEGMSRITAG